MILLLALLLQDLAALSNQGAAAMKEKRYADAVRIYQEIASRDPAAPEWRLNLGLALSYAGRHQDALTEVGVYLKARPAPGPAHFVSGLSLLKLGRYCDAIPQLESARKWKSSAEVLVELGDAYQGCKRWEAAAASYREASRVKPADKRLPRQIAHCWYMARQYDKVVATYPQLDGSHRNDPEILFEYGDSLVRTQGPLVGLPFLEKALESAPRLLAAQGALGRALMDLDRAADALPHLEAASREDPALLYLLSRAYRALGRSEEAARAEVEYKSRMGKARSVDPNYHGSK